MKKREPEGTRLFTTDELAAQIVDTLVDHGFIEKSRFNEAVTSVKWNWTPSTAWVGSS